MGVSRFAINEGGATGAAGPTGSSMDVAILSDVKAVSTVGGTFTAGAWRTRTLNTEVDAGAIVSLAANQFTLGAGTYLIQASAPAYWVNSHQLRIRNITDGTTDILGGHAYSPQADDADPPDSRAFLSGAIVIGGAKVFELQHQCSDTSPDDMGFGIDNPFGDGVFSIVTIMKVA